jgi:hypothetical protein
MQHTNDKEATNLKTKSIVSVPSEFCFTFGLTCISTQLFSVGANRTMLSKKSDKTCWILYWSPYADASLISSGISRISCKSLSLNDSITWLTTAFITLPRENSSFSSTKELLNKHKQNYQCFSNSVAEYEKANSERHLDEVCFWSLQTDNKLCLVHAFR